MNALINWLVEGIGGVLVILVGAVFILSALSSFFGPARVRWWFTALTDGLDVVDEEDSSTALMFSMRSL